jgi:hypothetical protein
VAQALEDLAETGRREAFRTLVVVFPRLDDPRFRSYGFSAEHAFVRDLARRNGMLFLDLLQAFRSCAASSPRRLDQEILHPTAEGHRCAAEGIVEYLARSVPRP